ncbi:MAG: gluconate 2-dehydrogenase subunit 3 family protein [Opitutus sp.]|nr:gluconate 2-dehydrogenase subunit 3 family protein [Opitutus sp.]
MNSPSPATNNRVTVLTMTRRQAIQRAAIFLGAALSPSLLSGVMRAQSAPAAAGAKPVYLTAKQLETATALAERILPRTDTPGAREVGVPAFIDLMYGKYLSPEEKKLFAGGLTEVETASTATHQRPFAQLSPAQQDAQLTRLAGTSKNQEGTFFYQLKELVVVGYFTSETVGKTVLHYDPVPGRFDACVPIAEVGNVNWTK